MPTATQADIKMKDMYRGAYNVSNPKSPTAIKTVYSREIMDSRGNPTVEVEIVLQNGVSASFKTPSGASTGAYEAHELRDGEKSRFGGKGTVTAAANVIDVLAPAIAEMDIFNGDAIDDKLISLAGENKKTVGANATLPVSLAIRKVAAAAKGLPLYKYLNPKANTLPIPMFNVLNGGAHAAGSVDLQEFMLMPIGAANFGQGLRMVSEVFQILKKETKVGVGDEGGVAPSLPSNEDALKIISQCIEKAGYKLGTDFKIALDPACSELWNHAEETGKKGQYFFWKGSKEYKTSEQMIEMFASWVEKYHIISIEDALGEFDDEGQTKLTQKLGSKIQLVGDDYFVTNPKIFEEKGIKANRLNAILLKINQIGSFKESQQIVDLAKKHNYSVVVSHRSGETEDDTIADLAVAWGSSQIKTGSTNRSDRIAKFNRILAIQQYMETEGVTPKFWGKDAFFSINRK
jgi:enolase